jgi:predicted TIM-barrel fold metal-dependent hydrolase
MLRCHARCEPFDIRLLRSAAVAPEYWAALAEIAYALDVLKADGVTFFTRYGHGNYYLGPEEFKPIWEEVNRKKAVVFVHPTHPVDTNLVHRTLPQPVLDYPHEMTRTAMDMIMSGTKRAYHDCQVFLSHSGGTIPFLLPRAAQLVSKLPPRFNSTKSTDEILEDMKSFYLDLALATSPEILDTLLKHFPHDKNLFGSDMPYA